MKYTKKELCLKLLGLVDGYTEDELTKAYLESLSESSSKDLPLITDAYALLMDNLTSNEKLNEDEITCELTKNTPTVDDVYPVIADMFKRSKKGEGSMENNDLETMSHSDDKKNKKGNKKSRKRRITVTALFAAAVILITGSYALSKKKAYTEKLEHPISEIVQEYADQTSFDEIAGDSLLEEINKVEETVRLFKDLQELELPEEVEEASIVVSNDADDIYLLIERYKDLAGTEIGEFSAAGIEYNSIIAQLKAYKNQSRNALGEDARKTVLSALTSVLQARAGEGFLTPDEMQDISLKRVETSEENASDPIYRYSLEYDQNAISHALYVNSSDLTSIINSLSDPKTGTDPDILLKGINNTKKLVMGRNQQVLSKNFNGTF